jgi:hypothetical protein
MMAQALIMSLPSGDARRTKDVWKYGGGTLSYQLPCRPEYSVINLSSTHDNGDLLCRTVSSGPRHGHLSRHRYWHCTDHARLICDCSADTRPSSCLARPLSSKAKVNSMLTFRTFRFAASIYISSLVKVGDLEVAVAIQQQVRRRFRLR